MRLNRKPCDADVGVAVLETAPGRDNRFTGIEGAQRALETIDHLVHKGVESHVLDNSDRIVFRKDNRLHRNSPHVLPASFSPRAKQPAVISSLV